MVVLDDADFAPAAWSPRSRICSPCGPGLRDHDQAAGAPRAAGRDRRAGRGRTWPTSPTATRPTRPDLHGPADQRAAARQGGRAGPAGRRRGRDAGRPAARRSDPGLLLRPDPARRRRPGQRDRAGGGVRPGARGHRATTRRRRRRGSPTTPSTACPARCTAPTRTGRRGGPPDPHRHGEHQRRQLLRPRTCRSAATSSRASAGRWAWPGWRSSWSARPCRGGDRVTAAGGHRRPRGRHVRLRALGRGGAGRLGRGRDQGGARGRRRPAARAAADRLVPHRGRPEPEHRARQPRQAQHRPGHGQSPKAGRSSTSWPSARTCS